MVVVVTQSPYKIFYNLSPLKMEGLTIKKDVGNGFNSQYYSRLVKGSPGEAQDYIKQFESKSSNKSLETRETDIITDWKTQKEVYKSIVGKYPKPGMSMEDVKLFIDSKKSI